MKKVMLSALIGAFTLFNAGNAFSVIAVLKEGTGLTAGGMLNPVFEFADSSNVVQVQVDDTFHHENTASWNIKRGDATQAPGAEYLLFKFDLSSLGAGAVINTAELRLYESNGNAGISLAPILTHDWTEEDVTGNSPTGDNTAGNRWGPTGDDPYSSADYGIPSPFDHSPNGNFFLVEDVTSLVQSGIDSPASYYGWSVQVNNRNIYLSEDSNDGTRPALFIDYTPGGGGLPGDFDGDNDVDGNDFLVWQRDPNLGSLADWQNNYAPLMASVGSVPEPSTLILISVCSLLGMVRCRSRRSLIG